MSKVFLSLARYGDSVPQTQDHVLFPYLFLNDARSRQYQTWSANLQPSRGQVWSVHKSEAEFLPFQCSLIIIGNSHGTEFSRLANLRPQLLNQRRGLLQRMNTGLLQSC